MHEFDLIALIRARARVGAGTGADDPLLPHAGEGRGESRLRVSQPSGVILGIGDDAALLRGRPGWDLVVSTDTLNEGVHFPASTAPANIGWKALAVNLSDLAAMGAEPAWCTLSLSLPRAEAAWLEAFLDGFLALAAEAGIALVGGDTTRGPLSVAVTVIGQVEAGHALRRDRARVGDDVWVSGTLGDAAAALRLVREIAAHAGTSLPDTPLPSGISRALRARLDRPSPRLVLGRRLCGPAHACVDVSDGLLADLGHVCRASGVGAEIDADALPASAALQTAVPDPADRLVLQAAGGDDYELCFTAQSELREVVADAADCAAIAVTRIGRIVAGQGVHLVDRSGRELALPDAGYEHFGRRSA